MTEAVLAPPHVFPPAPRALAAHPVVVRVKAALASNYGEKLKQVILFGSRARGDAGPESDWDFLALVEGAGDMWDEQARLAPAVTWRLESDMLAPLSIFPLAPEAVRARTGFLHNVRREGLSV
jgi:predicted nucleotidyltransferase